MKIENCKLKISKKAFTLIEIMIAIAIVGIMAAVILVSMKSYGGKARSSKALAQLSSAIPSMVSCWGNGYTVKSPGAEGGDVICCTGAMCATKLTSYGYYPDLSTGDLVDYSYDQIDMTKNSWHFGVENSTDSMSVCCNMTMNSCQVISGMLTSSNCDDNNPSN